MLSILTEVGPRFSRMEESVSDSEVDFGSCKEDRFPKVGNKRWPYAVRRVSIGWSPVREAGLSSNTDTASIHPKRLVELLRIPSVNTYSTLKRKLIKSKSNPEWILEFLQQYGLEILFESLDQLANQKSSTFLDSVLLISCAECIKTVMDSSLGLDYIVENKEQLIRKFASGTYFLSQFSTITFICFPLLIFR